MALLVLAIAILCLLLSSNLQTQQRESQPLHDPQESSEAVAELQHLLDLGLPRKLRISEELATKLENADEAWIAYKEEDDDFPGEEEQINEMHGINGEWDEDDPLEHFTMDYYSVKRRRPIHNMATQHP